MPAAQGAGDPLVGLAGLAHALAAAGLPVASDAVAAFTRALREVEVGNPEQVYWAGRATLCRGPDDIPRYDSAFAAWFGGTVPARVPRSGELPRRARTAAMTTTNGGDIGGDAPQLRVAADDTEVLRHRNIADLTAAERAHLAELIAALRPRPPTRPAIRMRPARRGRWTRGAPYGACSRRAANRCGRASTAKPPGHAGWCCSSTCPDR